MVTSPLTHRRGILPSIVVLAGGVVALGIAGPISALDLAFPLIWAGGWLAILTLATFGAGDLLLPVRQDRDRLEQVTLALAAGAGVLIAVAGLLGAAHLFRGTSLLLVLGLAACRGGLRASRLSWTLAAPRDGLPAVLLLTMVGVVSLLAATTPSPFYDQWNYHLAFPFHWLRVGSLSVQPLHAYSFLPANAGLLFSYALAGPGPAAAQVTTWWCCALAAIAAAAITRRLTDHSQAPILAAALTAASPSIAEMSTVSLADPLVMAFAGAAWLAIIPEEAQSTPTGKPVRLLTCGTFIGLAVGAKYTAGLTVAIPVGVAAVIAHRREGPDRLRLPSTLKPLLLVTLVAIAVFIPWMIRNTALTGTPTYPYTASRSAPAATDVQDIGSLGVSRERTIAVASLGAVGTRGFAARTGVQFLWLVPLVVLDAARRRRSPRGRWTRSVVAGVAAGLICSLALPNVGRYLAALLVPLAALCAAAWYEQLAISSTGRRAVLNLALMIVLLGGLNPVRTAYAIPQLRVASGLEDSVELLRREVSSWTAMEASNELLPPGSHVLLVAESRSYGFEHEITVQDSFSTPVLVTIATASRSPDDVVRELRRRGYTHLLMNTREMERLDPGGDASRFLRCPNPRSQAFLDAAIRGLDLIWADPSCQLLALPGTRKSPAP